MITVIEFLKSNQSPVLWAGMVMSVIFFMSYLFLFAAPADFKPGSIVIINYGSSVSEISNKLADAHIISRPFIFKLILRAQIIFEKYSGTQSINNTKNNASINNISVHNISIKAGKYIFNTPENIFQVVDRLIKGEGRLPLIRLTIPEGFTVRDIAKKVSQALPHISEINFSTTFKDQEGYLFPDTYFFFPDATSELIIKTMQENFKFKTASRMTEISASGYSLKEIITLASLVEKEARTDVDKKVIAGILLKRLKIGMPLQVDAVFGYIFGRDIYSPSYKDLKVISPYNTYLNAGLPPGPIANPGLESIRAVLQPTTTPYLYYLTGKKDGAMHYAKTYSEHLSNKNKYLATYSAK